MPEAEAPAFEAPPDVDAGGPPDELACDEPGCEYMPKATLPGPLRRGQLTQHLAKKHGRRPPPKAKKVAAKRPAAQRSPRVGGTPAPSTGRRKSASNILSAFWGLLGSRVPGNAGALMVWQSPAAGPILDKLAAGTKLDRWALQKVANQEDRWGDALALAVVPGVAMLVESGAYDRAPDVAKEAMRGMAEDSVMRSLGSVLDEIARRNRELAALEARALAAGFKPQVVQTPDGPLEVPAMRAELDRVMGGIFRTPPAEPPPETVAHPASTVPVVSGAWPG